MKTLFFHQDVAPCADIALHELAGLYLAKRKNELDERDYRNIRKTFELAAEFKPHSGTGDWDGETLEDFQKFLMSRYTLNGIKMHVKFFRQVFYWAVVKKLVSSGLCYELSKVPAPRPDRCRKNKKRLDIKWEIVESQLKYYPAVIQDMIRVQYLTGMRPNEVCLINLSEIDKTLFADRWIFCPEKHKNAWRGHERKIIFGRAVKDIIERNANKNRDFVFVSPQAKKPFDEDNYRQTITRYQLKNNLTRWVPYQLRHTAFTEVAEEFGIEMADVFVGHLLKTSGKHYDNSALARQWYVVSRRQGSLALKSEFVPASMRLYTGE